jgi:hypothetical protein
MECWRKERALMLIKDASKQAPGSAIQTLVGKLPNIETGANANVGC